MYQSVLKRKAKEKKKCEQGLDFESVLDAGVKCIQLNTVVVPWDSFFSYVGLPSKSLAEGNLGELQDMTYTEALSSSGFAAVLIGLYMVP